MKTRDLAATCKLYRLVLSQGGRHVASQWPTFTAREKAPPRDHQWRSPTLPRRDNDHSRRPLRLPGGSVPMVSWSMLSGGQARGWQ